jgi:hypothetical protein
MNHLDAQPLLGQIVSHYRILEKLRGGGMGVLYKAYVVSGDTTKARIAYQDFLTPWKDADLDIPVLKQAKAEYAKLQQ